MSRQIISTQRIVISAHTVEFMDPREPKFCPIQTETVTYNEDALARLDAMGMDRMGYIEERYTRDGHKVLSITKAPCRVVYVDIAALYRQAEREAAKKELAATLAKMNNTQADATEVRV